MFTRLIIALTTVLIGMFLQACGIHLHRPEDASLAEKCETSFKDAKLTETLKAEIGAAGSVLKEEVAAIRRQSSARRDRLLANAIGGEDGLQSWGVIERYATTRLDELVGSPANDAAISTWLTARENLDYQFETVRQAYLTYEQKRGASGPALRIFSRLKASQVPTTGPAAAAYSAYTGALGTYEATQTQASVPASADGLAGKLAAQRDDTDLKIKTASAAAAALKDQIDTLKSQRDAKIAEAKLPGKTADEISKALEEAAGHTKSLKTLLEPALDAANSKDLTEVAKRIEAIEEIRSTATIVLNKASQALAGHAPDKLDTEMDKLLSSLTAIRTGIDKSAYPKTSDLLLEMEHLRIEQDRLKGILALEEERRSLLDLQLGAVAREVQALRRVQFQATAAQPYGVLSAQARSTEFRISVMPTPATGSFKLAVNGETTQPITLPTDASALATALVAVKSVGAGNALVTGNGPWAIAFGGALTGKEVSFTADTTAVNGGAVQIYSVRAVASESLMSLAESWSVGRTQIEELNFLLCGIDHRAALENSGAAFAQWNNLIGVPLTQLVAYHKSGIRSEDLANLINAAGLGAIAVGVN